MFKREKVKSHTKHNKQMLSVASGLEHFMAEIHELPEEVRKKVFWAEPNEAEQRELDKFNPIRMSLFTLLSSALPTDFPFLRAVDFQNEVDFKPENSKATLLEKAKQLVATKRYKPFLLREQQRTLQKQTKLARAVKKNDLSNACSFTGFEVRMILIMEQCSHDEAEAKKEEIATFCNGASTEQLKQFLREESAKVPISYGGRFYQLNREEIEALPNSP